MKFKESIKPISYLKAHASELIREVANEHKTLIITKNGEAQVLVQDLDIYEKMMESLAILKMLAQSNKSKSEGNFKPVKKSFKELRKRLKEQT